LATYPYRYTLFGLNIFTQMAFPEFDTFENPTLVNGDVFIFFDDVPEHLGDAHQKRPWFETATGCLLVHPPGIGRFLVDRGCQIRVNSGPNASESVFKSFLFGWGLAAILHQRGYLPLHASAVATNQGVIVFCGKPGAGKSTIAAALNKYGFELVSDDKLAVVLQDQNIMVYPSFPQLRLWDDAIKHLEISMDGALPLADDAEKFIVPMLSSFTNRVLPLRAVYILTPSDVENVNIIRLQGMEKFNVLMLHTYGRRFLSGLGVQAGHFQLASSVASKIQVAKIFRPCDRFALDDLVELVVKDITS
jgi:hypothetical protein